MSVFVEYILRLNLFFGVKKLQHLNNQILTVCSVEHTVKCTVQINTQNTAQSFGQFGQMVECSFTN